MKQIQEGLKTFFEKLELNHAKGELFISSGLEELDYYSGGFSKGNLHIIASCPSGGKTSFIISSISNILKNSKRKVGLISIESSDYDILLKLFSDFSEIELNKLKLGKFRAEQGAKMSRMIHQISKSPLFLNSTSINTIMDVKKAILELYDKEKIDIIFIDCIQLINIDKNNIPSASNREQEVSFIARELKLLARELDIAIVATSQINRAYESRVDKRPILSDLRDSGTLEYIADIVLLLYRPELFGIVYDPEGQSTQNIVFIYCHKNRFGPFFEFKARFIPEHSRFLNLQT